MSEAQTHQKKKILIVDDSMLIRQLVTQSLEPEGYEVIAAVDGMDALDKLVEGDPASFSLVLLDVNMPRMGGIELLSAMAERAWHFPIVMLTTEGQESLIRKAKSLGAVAWLIKPTTTAHLVTAVNRITSGRVSARISGANRA